MPKKKINIKHTYTVVTENGTTDDIIDVVMSAYKLESDEQIRDLASELKQHSDIESCRNIFDFLVSNIRYVADVQVQEVKSPARLVHDATGDCKSYSIFTAAILRYLNIDHFFRFVSYTNDKRATHVYVVAVIDNKELPIDAVAKVQANINFGKELKYRYKCDMREQTTKIAYLAGVSATIGNTSNDVNEFLNSGAFDVWMYDSEDITLAKGYLLSEWDVNWTLYQVAKTATERIELLSRLKYVALMLMYYNAYRNDVVMLENGAYAFDFLIEKKAFHLQEDAKPEDVNFFDDEDFDYLVYIANENINRYSSTNFIRNWQTNIIDANVPSVAGIGNVGEIRDNLKKTGGYYLYSFIPEADANKYGAVVYRKRLIQNRIKGLTKDALVTSKTMTQAEIDNLIISGCVTTWGGTPTNVIYDLSKPRIGVIDPATITLIVKLIVAAITVIVAIIKAVRELKQTDEQTIKDGAARDDDFDPGKIGKKEDEDKEPSLLKSGTGFILPMFLLGTLFFKSKPKKK
jgi:uncharacterized protein affecting Mg2+/Co2+ transport